MIILSLFDLDLNGYRLYIMLESDIQITSEITLDDPDFAPKGLIS